MIGNERSKQWLNRLSPLFYTHIYTNVYCQQMSSLKTRFPYKQISHHIKSVMSFFLTVNLQHQQSLHLKLGMEGAVEGDSAL